jgi:hypothetical protein
VGDRFRKNRAKYYLIDFHDFFYFRQRRPVAIPATFRFGGPPKNPGQIPFTLFSKSALAIYVVQYFMRL